MLRLALLKRLSKFDPQEEKEELLVEAVRLKLKKLKLAEELTTPRAATSQANVKAPLNKVKAVMCGKRHKKCEDAVQKEKKMRVEEGDGKRGEKRKRDEDEEGELEFKTRKRITGGKRTAGGKRATGGATL